MPVLIADGWNHNTHYHDVLLQSVPPDCHRALDIGCGTGAFARRLSRLAEQVDAIDADPAVIRRARDLSIHSRNLHFIEADFMTWAAEDSYDFVSMIAAVHHLPFAEALTKAANLLRPGGVLVVFGLDRAPSPLHEMGRSLIAYPVSRYYRAFRRTAPVAAPTLEPMMTLSEIRRNASALLPRATIRRHLLWRYSLIWTKP